MRAKALRLSAGKRLGLLRQLDRSHTWQSADERRLCLGCGQLIRGWEIKVLRSMGGLGPLRLRCPSEGCVAGPLNWVMPNDSGSAEIKHGQSGAHPHGTIPRLA